ncbi:MAG TPA: hypothetical protein VF744_04210 [Beijerinckiaceae bacterium]|jgi:hypothetical protein
MSARRLTRSLINAGAETGRAAVDSAATIAARLPILMSPTVEGMAEWNRAYTEKVAAAWTGFFAASTAWQEVMIRAAFRPPSPMAFANDVVRVSHKAGHAARKAVKANAKRLGRRPSS